MVSREYSWSGNHLHHDLGSPHANIDLHNSNDHQSRRYDLDYKRNSYCVFQGVDETFSETPRQTEVAFRRSENQGDLSYDAVRKGLSGEPERIWIREALLASTNPHR